MVAVSTEPAPIDCLVGDTPYAAVPQLLNPGWNALSSESPLRHLCSRIHFAVSSR
jgi:hypothetical protein